MDASACQCQDVSVATLRDSSRHHSQSVAPTPDGGTPPPTADVTWTELPAGAAPNLLLAGLDAFAAKGYHATTTRDISGAAGLSPAAMYVHFPSKSDLLRHICFAGHRSAANAGEAADNDPTLDPMERLRHRIAGLLDWHTAHRQLARVIQQDLRFLDPEDWAMASALRDESERTVRARIRAAKVAAGLPTKDLRLETVACWSMIIDVSRWYRPASEPARRRFVATYTDMIIRMLGFDLSTSS